MSYPALVHVTSVEPLEGFALRLSFDDGSTRETDVKWLLRGPIFEPLLADPDLFRQVERDGSAESAVGIRCGALCEKRK